MSVARAPSPLAILGWQKLGDAHRRWIVARAIVATAVINAVLNAAIAWATTRGPSTLTMWSFPSRGETNILIDAVATLFLLPLITTVICTAAIRQDLRAGKLEPLRGGGPGVVAHLTGRPFRRGLVLGGICVVTLSPLAVATLAGLHAGGLTMSGFVLYKAIFAVILGMIVTPLIAVRAMAESPSRAGAGPWM